MRYGAELMLLNLVDYEKPDLTERRPAGLWDAYFRMTGVEALYETVKGKPFVKMSPKKQSYGDLEFEVRDPNGYILVFGGERFWLCGLSERRESHHTASRLR